MAKDKGSRKIGRTYRVNGATPGMAALAAMRARRYAHTAANKARRAMRRALRTTTITPHGLARKMHRTALRTGQVCNRCRDFAIRRPAAQGV